MMTDTSFVDVAKKRYEGIPFDSELPEHWVEACRERGFEPLGHFVWLYDTDSFLGRPAPVSLEGDRIVGLLAKSI